MPIHCEPWPGNTNTDFGWVGPASVSAVMAFGWGLSVATASSASARSASSARRPSTTARYGIRGRVFRGGGVGAGSAAGGAGAEVGGRAGWARRAAGLRADTTHITLVSGSAALLLVVGSVAGACSRTTWALVPEIP